MKYFFMAFVLLISANKLNAQVISNESISQRVAVCLQKNYKPDTANLVKLCRQACVFMKMKVNKKGLIDVAFSGDSTTVVTQALYKAVVELQKDTQLIAFLKKTKKTIIQPFVYDYRVGCKIPTIDTKTMQAAEEKLYRTEEFLKIVMKREQTQATLSGMLNFDGSDFQVIDCLLLKPYRDFLSDLPY